MIMKSMVFDDGNVVDGDDDPMHIIYVALYKDSYQRVSHWASGWVKIQN